MFDKGKQLYNFLSPSLDDVALLRKESEVASSGAMNYLLYKFCLKYGKNSKNWDT